MSSSVCKLTEYEHVRNSLPHNIEIRYLFLLCALNFAIKKASKGSKVIIVT